MIDMFYDPFIYMAGLGFCTGLCVGYYLGVTQHE